jgi:hypothetical protein
MRELAGTVIDPAVMGALTSAVEARRALIFIDESNTTA